MDQCILPMCKYFGRARSDLGESGADLSQPAANISRDTALVDAPAWRYYFNISFPDNVFAPGFGSLGVYHTRYVG